MSVEIAVPMTTEVGRFPVAESFPLSSLPSPEQDRLKQVNNIPIDAAHTFPVNNEGEDLGLFARKLLFQTRLPLTRISEIGYIPNRYGTHDVLGSYEIAGDHQGRMGFYKNMEMIPAIGQFAVALHEGAHASSPLDETAPGINEDYGGEKNRERAKENVIKVANQAAATGIFLNGYHEYIFNLEPRMQEQVSQAHPELSGEQIHSLWESIWLEETHAIASELAATNYFQLSEVERRQFEALKEMGQKQAFVPLTSRRWPDGKIRVSGIDQTLMDLTKIGSIEELRNYWSQIHDQYDGAQTPFHHPGADTDDFLPFIPGTEVIIIGIIYKRRSRWDNELEELLENLQPPTRRGLTIESI